MLEKQGFVTRAFLVNLRVTNSPGENQLEEIEFNQLAKSGGMQVIGSVSFVIDHRKISPKYLIRKGQLSKLLLLLADQEIEVVVFNYDISASQQKNLEDFLNCKILDRTELILYIFAERARSFEGKLQVKLASLQHLSTRLIRVWTHLERQRGGVGLRAGPGEKQLELDRRIIKQSIFSISKKLDKIKTQRRLHRNLRKKSRLPTVAIVGYTNAGKSTLFNLLTNSKVQTLDLPFVTLDPTVRQIMVPKFGEIVLTDTVGFIRDLPHHLVEAFQATLEEVATADLLLHVIDISDEHSIQQRQNVLKVLEQINASHLPILEVYNKIDKNLDLSVQDLQFSQPGGSLIGNYGVKISALKQIGIEELMQQICSYLSPELVRLKLNLLPQHANIRVELQCLKALDKETIDPITGEFLLEINVSKLAWEKLCNKFIDLPKMIVT